MKKSLKIILSLVVLLIGVLVLFFAYKVFFTNKTMIEIYKKENDYKIYLKDDEKKDISGYKLYKTIGIDILENEKIASFDVNVTNDKLNGIIINYEETVVEQKDGYSMHQMMNCQDDICVFRYNSYYNLDKNKNQFKDMKLYFSIWNEDYIVSECGAAQTGVVYDLVFNIKTEKTIIKDLKDKGPKKIYFLKNNNHKYIYVAGDPIDYNTDRLYDENGTLLLESKKEKFSLNYKCQNDTYCSISKYEEQTHNSIKSYIEDIDSYYLVEDGVISKYNLDGTKISSSKKYDNVYQVISDYSLIYQKSDNSIYIIKNDDSFSKKITTKNNDIYSFSIYDNAIRISEGRSAGEEAPADITYIYNLKTDKITIQEQ